MNLAGHDIGVCSWSLATEEPADFILQLRETKLEHVHLAIAPLLAMENDQQHAQLEVLTSADIRITAGMIQFPGEDYSTLTRARKTTGFVPDDFWPERREIIALAADICAQSGIRLLSTHIGFIPPSSGDKYEMMVNRVGEIVSDMEKQNVALLIETGQQSASELLQFLNDLPGQNAFINFDPANFVLYGNGDPIEAVDILGRHIRHMHLKDAKESAQPGATWGTQVPLGQGEIPFDLLLEKLRQANYAGPLVIECESSSKPLREILQAIKTIETVLHNQ